MDQPRVPAGSPEGGQFTSKGGSAGGSGGSSGAVDHQDMVDNRVPLTPAQQTAVKNYRDTGYYHKIAAKLRGESGDYDDYDERFSDSDVDWNIKHLDEAIAAQKPLEQDITVYRGLNADAMDEDIRGNTPEARAADFVGTWQTIQDGSFVSTSASARVAARFAGAGGLVLKIRVPKGTRVLPIESGETLKTAGEQEILLARDSKVKLIGVVGKSPHYREGSIVIDAEVQE